MASSAGSVAAISMRTIHPWPRGDDALRCWDGGFRSWATAGIGRRRFQPMRLTRTLTTHLGKTGCRPGLVVSHIGADAGQGVGTAHRWNDRMVAAMSHVELGRAALRVGDGAGARAQFELGELTPEVLEGLAAASYVLLEYPRAIAEFERAYAGYRQQGDGAGSARVARTLGYMYGTTAGDWAVAGGWIARAKTLLSDLPTVERTGMGGADRGHVRRGPGQEGGRLPHRDRDRARRPGTRT